MNSSIIISGTVSAANVIETLDDTGAVIGRTLSAAVTHTGPQPADPTKAPRISAYEIEAANGVATWAAANPLPDGTPVTIFGYRMENQADAAGAVWLKVYANGMIIRTANSPEVTSGILVGRVGQDAEMRTLPNGTPYSNFNLAVDYGIWSEAEQKWDNQTTWCKCTVWGSKPTAEHQSKAPARAQEKVKKGAVVEVVVSDFHTSRWADREGCWRLSVEVTASAFSVLKEPSAPTAAPEPAIPPIARAAAAAAAAAAAGTRSATPAPAAAQPATAAVEATAAASVVTEAPKPQIAKTCPF